MITTRTRLAFLSRRKMGGQDVIEPGATNGARKGMHGALYHSQARDRWIGVASVPVHAGVTAGH